MTSTMGRTALTKLNILITGASIAGPTAAYWLAKTGANITIIERYPKFRRGGQNVDIRTSGVHVMNRMPGMEAAVRAKVTPMVGASMVDKDGQPYGTMRPTGDPNQQSLVSEFEIFRDDLALILYDLTKDNNRIKYVFGEQVSSMQRHETHDGPITVSFTNGYPTTQYDLVVACDGSTSRTRAIGLDCSVREHIHPVGMWGSFFSLNGDLLDGRKVGEMYNEPGGRGVAISPDSSGITRVWAFGTHPKDLYELGGYHQAKRKGEQAMKDFVAKRFEGCAWKCNEIFEKMMHCENFYTSEIVQVKVPQLSRGRFVLVGDAGYAPGPTGGGTSLALVGGYILAGEIAACNGDIEAGLRGYEQSMAPFIKDMQKIPPGVISFMGPQTAWGLWFRNVVFTLVAFGMSFGKYFSWIPGLFASGFAPTGITLPEYEFKY